MMGTVNKSGSSKKSKGSRDLESVEEAKTEGDLEGVPLKKGPWTSGEDAILVEYVEKYGEGNWNAVQKHSGLSRCGKSCRLRWANHLRPDLKKGAFTPEEECRIIEMHAKMGNKWARMAAEMIDVLKMAADVNMVPYNCVLLSLITPSFLLTPAELFDTIVLEHGHLFGLTK